MASHDLVRGELSAQPPRKRSLGIAGIDGELVDADRMADRRLAATHMGRRYLGACGDTRDLVALSQPFSPFTTFGTAARRCGALVGTSVWAWRRALPRVWSR